MKVVVTAERGVGWQAIVAVGGVLDTTFAKVGIEVDPGRDVMAELVRVVGGHLEYEKVLVTGVRLEFNIVDPEDVCDHAQVRVKCETCRRSEGMIGSPVDPSSVLGPCPHRSRMSDGVSTWCTTCDLDMAHEACEPCGGPQDWACGVRLNADGSRTHHPCPKYGAGEPEHGEPAHAP